MEDLEQLLAQAKSGDENAFKEIFKLFYKRIYRYCFLNLYNQENAKDICQETFIKAWKNLPKFNLWKGGSFQAYLFRIARNCIIDLSRRKKELPLDQALEIEAIGDTVEDLTRQENINQIRKALSSLKEEEKQLVTLRYFEELSFTEVAAVMGVSEGSLRVRVSRILRKLKDMLQDNNE